MLYRKIDYYVTFFRSVLPTFEQCQFPALHKHYWGQHLWGKGYFCATGWRYSEEQVKKYIEGKVEEDINIKIWDKVPSSMPNQTCAAFMRILEDFSLTCIYAIDKLPALANKSLNSAQLLELGNFFIWHIIL